MKKVEALAAFTVGVLMLAVPPVTQAQGTALGGFTLKSFSITAGAGGSVPVRSTQFVNDTRGLAFYRFVAGEYSLSPRISLGAQYSGANFDLEEGQQYKTSAWGPYAITFFDLIPKNHWELFLKFGALKNKIKDFPANPQWQLLAGGGVEFFALGNVKGRVGVDFNDVYENQIGAMFFYMGLNFDPLSLLVK